jgi:hypothetical protein
MQRLPRPDLQQYDRCVAIWAAKEMTPEEEAFFDGFDLSAELFGEEGAFGLRSAIGDVLLPPLYDEIFFSSVPPYTVGSRFTVVSNGRYGVVRANGANEPIELVPAIYTYIGRANAHAHFCADGKWGVLDTRTGEHLIPAEYDSIADHDGLMFSNSFAVLTKDGKYGVMDISLCVSQVIFDEVTTEFLQPVKVRIADRWGYIDADGGFTEDEERATWRCDML